MNRSLLFVMLMMCLLLWAEAHADILISEISPDNHCIYFDEQGKTPDWIELYNSGA